MFCIEVYLINNVMIVSGEQWRDSAMHIYVSILPQTLLPYRLLHNSEQSSLCCTIGPCWLPIVNIAECVYDHFRLPDYPFPLATVSSFYKSVSLFLKHSISQLIELCCSLIVFLIFFNSLQMFSFSDRSLFKTIDFKFTAKWNTGLPQGCFLLMYFDSFEWTILSYFFIHLVFF